MSRSPSCIIGTKQIRDVVYDPNNPDPSHKSDVKMEKLSIAIYNAIHAYIYAEDWNNNNNNIAEKVAELVRKMLQKGADPSYVMEDAPFGPMSLLRFAAKKNMRDVCFVLTQYGADPHQVHSQYSAAQTPIEQYGRGDAWFAVQPLPPSVVEQDRAEMLRLRAEYVLAKTRRENMQRRLPFLCVLKENGFMHKDEETRNDETKQPTPDECTISRKTKDENRAYLLQAIFANRNLRNQIIIPFL